MEITIIQDTPITIIQDTPIIKRPSHFKSKQQEGQHWIQIQYQENYSKVLTISKTMRDSPLPLEEFPTIAR
jgi:hypothetical protein